MADPNQQSSGVEDLIQQLKDKGVDAGKKEADAIVEEAHRRAGQIVAKAKAEAEQHMKISRADMEANYDKFVNEMGFYSDKDETEQLILELI